MVLLVMRVAAITGILKKPHTHRPLKVAAYAKSFSYPVSLFPLLVRKNRVREDLAYAVTRLLSTDGYQENYTLTHRNHLVTVDRLTQRLWLSLYAHY